MKETAINGMIADEKTNPIGPAAKDTKAAL